MKRGVIVWNTIDGFMQTEVPIGRFETWTAANAALEEAWKAIEPPHSSGCGKIFEWPFSSEMTDGCNCGVTKGREYKALRTLAAKEPSDE